MGIRTDKNIIKHPPASPFVGGRNRYEASVPLLQTFRFVHEPLGVVSTSRFIGRQNEMESLTERILFSEGGSFLVTGYRGVGKTSFINQVIRKLEEALPWAETFLGKTEIVDIYLNVARPVQPSEIMHHIIRQLHDRLIEKGIYHLLSEELKNALTLAYQRTSVNMARKLAESSERSFGFNEASIGGDWMKAAVKMSLSSKRSRTHNHEISFLGYDDKSAEHDIINISRRLAEGYVKPMSRWERLKSTFRRVRSRRVRLKIVFVFDELDKLEEFTPKGDGEQKPAIDQILGALKNLFTTSGVTFVFIAGKDLHERWLEDVGRGDSVYESVFSYDKYLSCLWADVDLICDGLIDASATLKPYTEQVFTEFKKYLAYKGRGIPRRIIRTFNEYVEWNGDQPILAFTRQDIRNIRFFAGLQDVLVANENQLVSDSHEEALGTQSDKRRLGIYYLIDWILRQGSTEFTLRNVLNASKRLSAKIALAEEIAAHVAEKIIKILLDADYIQEVQKSLNSVVIGAASALRDEQTLMGKRYKIAPRRLGEMGGLAAEVELDMKLDIHPTLPDTNDLSVTNIGKYRIVRILGQGGMGAVFEATDEYNGRKVALKVVVNGSTPEMVARFEREAMIMNELNHPNVIRLYDWGKDDGRSYIAMEYLDGITLEDLIGRMGKLSLDLVVAIVKPIAEAAQYVHQKGFVRNDIKPSNIMLTSTGRVCLLDFGITKPAHPMPKLGLKFETTIHGAFVGTPIYAPPEQIQEHTVDARSDIYSLGVVLYRMLTGVFPFSGSNIMGLLQAHVSETLIPASQHVKLPAAVDEIISRCLEKNPNQRFQTMTEVVEALGRAIGDLPPVNLGSVVNVARMEVKKVEAMDNMHTRERLTFSAGVHHKSGTWPRSLARGELSDIPAMMGGSASQTSHRHVDVHEARPRITLLRGRLENIEFDRTGSAPTYFLQKKTSIGRSSENSIVLRNEQVSRYHAELNVDNDGWLIEDFNSILGTFVNGERIDARRLLKDGDQIRIGDFVFIFNEVRDAT